jgi:ribosomal protein L29
MESGDRKMTDEQKTKEQLLTELHELKQEVEKLRSMTSVLSHVGEHHEELEQRVTEYSGWL